MDIEKTMEFILAQQANAEVQMAAIREQIVRTDAKSKEDLDAIRTIPTETAVIIRALRHGGNGNSKIQ